MLVSDAGDLHVGELVSADQAVEQHMGVEAVEGVVVEMSMGRDADIDLRFREVVEVPVPISGSAGCARGRSSR